MTLDQSTPSTPRRTGRRRTTSAQLQATGSLSGRLDELERGRVLAAFKAAAPAMGYAPCVVQMLDLLFRYSRNQDWQAGQLRYVWPSNEVLMDSTGLTLSGVRKRLRRLIDLGLIRAHDIGTGRRWGQRDPRTGCILQASGFDLSPVGERMAEFTAAAEALEAHRQEVRMWRRECSAWSRKMLSLADHGIAEKLAHLDWPSLAAEAQRLAAVARAERDPLELAAIKARLRRLYEESAQQLQAVPPAAEAVESAPQDALRGTPITPTDQLLIAEAIAAASGDLAPGGGRSRVAGQIAVQEPSGSCGGLLKGFPMSPALLLHLVPAYREWVGSAAPGWSEIQRACDVVRGHLGIPSQVYGQARAMFGTDGAAVVIGTIAVKHAMQRVGNPAGYLQRMVERHRSGELNLDRTLHGLAAAARSRQRSVGSLGQSRG
ncbi:plasmid replication protein RepC [Pseudoroseomonas sp. WGS1072]|uniref:plasmid replication protein RepC n=1 Tax=Roseomonas sp. WGS1072 TaxID=3366816 RepID=UPI003BF12840